MIIYTATHLYMIIIIYMIFIIYIIKYIILYIMIIYIYPPHTEITHYSAHYNYEKIRNIWLILSRNYKDQYIFLSFLYIEPENNLL